MSIALASTTASVALARSVQGAEVNPARWKQCCSVNGANVRHPASSPGGRISGTAPPRQEHFKDAPHLSRNQPVIQEITATFDAKKADGSPDFQKTYHYWKAWEVKQGKKVTIWQDQGLDDNDDQYFTGSRPGTN
jgi:hypothetical protein